ncbi:MAG: hypothetical protein GC160_24735 [Acidobacteria bacterium]|nr:hypothetical protein [Acidobacteriota bacterium]
MREHVRMVAILQIVWSAIGFLIGVVVLFLLGGFGMLLASEAAVSDPDAAAAPAFVGLAVGAIALIMVVLTAPGFLAGWGLLQGKGWARILTIVLCALNLFSLPIGTVLGVYGLWVMTQPEVEAQFAVVASPLGR